MYAYPSCASCECTPGKCMSCIILNVKEELRNHTPCTHYGEKNPMQGITIMIQKYIKHVVPLPRLLYTYLTGSFAMYPQYRHINNRLCFPCIVVCIRERKYMYHSMGYTYDNAISLFSWNQVINTTLLLTARHFVYLYQQNLCWYHQDTYKPTGGKLYLQKPKCRHTVSMV